MAWGGGTRVRASAGTVLLVLACACACVCVCVCVLGGGEGEGAACSIGTCTAAGTAACAQASLDCDLHGLRVRTGGTCARAWQSPMTLRCVPRAGLLQRSGVRDPVHTAVLVRLGSRKNHLERCWARTLWPQEKGVGKRG